MSAATMSSADAVKQTPASVGAAAKQQVKRSNSGKALDATRKQTASPVDGQKGRPPPQQKAWQGPNPITQRASTQTPNGNEKPLPKLPPQSENQMKSTAVSNAEKHAHDRALFLIANLTGFDAILTLKNGEQFTGIFSGGSFESTSKHQYTLKMVKRTRLPTHQQVNGHTTEASEYIGEGEDHMMVFDKDDTVELAVNDVITASSMPVQNGSIASSFRTDTEISGRDPSMPRERELQRWDAGNDDAIGMSLEDSGATGWDQFAANQRMYGVETSYDENIYTTAIDRSDPLYKQREAAAARIAREIEGSAAANAHVAEERRVDVDLADGLDEEEKYSGVQRESVQLPKRSAGAYVPPSQRPITNTPTVHGAPYDPAIISSSLAKPATQVATEKAVEAPTSTEASVTSGEETPSVPDTAASPKTQATQAPKKQGENTAEEHVRNTVDAFRLFANDQKLRSRQAMEARRSSARAEKNVKLNDLKKFAENFSLKSRIPDDLVAILAKDPLKQLEIQHRAEESAKQAELKNLATKERESQKTASTASPTLSGSSQAGTPALEQRSSFSQQQQNARARVTQNLRGMPMQQAAGKTLPIMPDNKGYSRTGPFPPVPGDVRIPTGPAIPSGEGPLSPGSKKQLNVQAAPFQFNPGTAPTFTPSGTSPSPQRTTQSSMDRSNVSNVSSSVKHSPLFGKNKLPIKASERKNIEDSFAPTLGMLDREYTEEHKKINNANGGIPKPYQTAPTWQYKEVNVNASFKDSFAKPQLPSAGPSPMHTPNPNAQMPHQHQLPPHLQGTPMSTPSQRPPYMQPPNQGGAPPQMFDPRMQQFGPNGSVQSSPRFPQAQMAFNGQMPGMGGMPQFGGQPMQGYGVSPSMQYRQMNMPPQGPMMMMGPGQQHGQMAPIPQGYPPRGPGGAPFNPQMMMGGGMPMMQQPSNSGYMNGPGGNPSYSPMPPPSQPHNIGGGPQHMQNPGGYANSPRPHMMQHTGSHQGFQPGMQQPFGAPSPGGVGGQHFPYHMQQRQMSGGGGGYMMTTPRQQFSVPNHPSPGGGGMGMMPGQGGMGQGDEGK